MPQVVITMRAGRTEEQIRRLAARVTDSVAESLEIAPERVRVLIHELDAGRIAEGGQLLADRGQEVGAA
jgi:4-oxalocrotonate tautomerase